MNEMEVVEHVKEAPKHKPAKRKRAKRAAQPVKVPAEFVGITATDCCADCKPTKCVITGVGICGHPMKGGLQSAFMVKEDVVARYGRAKKALAKAKIDV